MQLSNIHNVMSLWTDHILFSPCNSCFNLLFFFPIRRHIKLTNMLLLFQEVVWTHNFAKTKTQNHSTLTPMDQSQNLDLGSSPV